MCVIDFWNFLTIHIFEIKESIADISTELPCLGDLENPGRLPVQQVSARTGWWLSLVDFWNFFTIYVFEVRESIADISTELPCLGNLENPGRLPVQDVLGGTCDFVLSIFEIPSLFMFLSSGNPLLTFLLSFHVRGTSKIQVTSRFKRFSKLPKHSFFDKNALNL